MARRKSSPGPRRAIGYVRVSTEEQAASGGGQDAQRTALTAECAHRGWGLAKFAEDVYSAKSTLGRPNLLAAMDRLDAGEAEVLIVTKLDRLIRSAIDFYTILERAQKNGWELVVLDIGMDTSTPMGRAMAGMAAVFAQFERERIGERTREGMAAKKAAGTLTGPIGRPRSIPTKVRNRIVRESAAGKSLQKIADKLNDDGVPTAAGGVRWYKSTVQDVLRQERAERSEG